MKVKKNNLPEVKINQYIIKYVTCPNCSKLIDSYNEAVGKISNNKIIICPLCGETFRAVEK